VDWWRLQALVQGLLRSITGRIPLPDVSVAIAIDLFSFYQFAFSVKMTVDV
jgi:hypothetical protein